MSEFANSSNQSAGLKEKYDDEKIQHLAEGGSVEPEGLAEFLSSGVQHLADAAGHNLDAYGQNLHKAMSGDPEAQLALAQHNAGIASGTIQNVPGIKVMPEIPQSLGTVANDIHQMSQPLGTVANDIKQITPSGYGKIIAKPYAEGGAIEAPAGLDEYLGSTPSAAAPAAPTSTGEPAGLDEYLAPEMNAEKHGTGIEQLKTFGEGALQGAIGPLAPVAEQAASQALFGQTPEETSKNILGRQEANPMTHVAGEVTGLGASMATGLGEGAIAGHIGEALAEHALPEASTTLAKIGSRALNDSIQNMVIAGSDELSKLVLQDPNQSVESSIADIGLGGLIGGVIGGGLGAVSPLWTATMGGKAGTALTALSEKLGGIDGRIPDDVSKILETSGVELTPELKAVVAGDKQAQQLSTELLQNDAKAGKAYQTTVNNAHNEIADSMIGTLGGDPARPIPTEISKYEAGKNIGETLAKEYHEQISPLTKSFEDIKAKYSGKDLIPDRETTSYPDALNPYNPTKYDRPVVTKIPGTISKAADDIAQLAEKQGWTSSPSSEIMTEVNRVMKELPKQKTLKDLNNYMSAVGDNTASKLPFGQQTPLSRAGAMIKGILREAESDVAIQRLGETEGPETVAKFKDARAAYAQQAHLKEYLNDNLHIGGSTASFAKGLKEMATTDGESVLNRLSGKGNADLLSFMDKNYPKTAQAIKSAHLDTLLKSAADKAKDGQKISISALRSGLEKMSPELRNFIASPEALTKIDALGQVVDKLQPQNYNYSNTARTLVNALDHLPGSAMATAAMLTGHGPLASVLTAVMGKYLTHEAPATMKLALLKFLGSGAKIDAPAFKAMLQSMEATVKGESLLSKASKNVFKAEREVLPQHLEPSEKDRSKLQKQLDTLKTNPQVITNAQNPVAHYMPQHGVSAAETATRASEYLNTLKPAIKQPTPLDTPIKPTISEQKAYDNALNIAHQPLIVMNKIKAGTATPADVAALKAMYPNLYTRMAQKLTNDMTDALSKGEVIPYRTRLGLSQFLSQPMDSTMTPNSIQAAQHQPTAQPQQAPGKPPSASSMKGVEKLPSQYATQDQAREQRSRREKP